MPEEADGGQAFQLFNVGLRLARARCHSEKLRRLTIAGEERRFKDEKKK